MICRGHKLTVVAPTTDKDLEANPNVVEFIVIKQVKDWHVCQFY